MVSIIKIHKLARKSRPKIGLALGSGALLGFAHIGAIKVLEKNNIHIDCISGSSIGSIIGAMYSSTKDIKLIEKQALSFDFNTIIKLLDIKLSRKGFIQGKKLMKYIDKYLPVKNFKELKIPLIITGTDMKKGNKIFFDKGNLLEAIRASISIPFIFTPFEKNNREIVDGGILNPVPIDILFERNCDVVIAIDLMHYSAPFRTDKTTTFKEIFVNTISLMQKEIFELNLKSTKKKANKNIVVLRPNLKGFRVIDWKRSKEIIKRGEIAAIENINTITKIARAKLKYSLTNFLKNE